MTTVAASTAAAAPSLPSQVGGLLLFLVLVALMAGVHRAYVAFRRRRLLRAAERPLPGRTRDLPSAGVRRAS